MKKQSLYIGIIVGGAALLALAAFTGRPSTTTDARFANDGAYRDGLYQAQLDATGKRPARITIGRCATSQDRASFFAGYLRGYQDQTGHPAKLSGGDLATLTGYSEGIADGAHDRQSSLPFQVERSQRIHQAEQAYGQFAGV